MKVKGRIFILCTLATANMAFAQDNTTQRLALTEQLLGRASVNNQALSDTLKEAQEQHRAALAELCKVKTDHTLCPKQKPAPQPSPPSAD